MSKIIGIDLGTTNSVVAVIDKGDPRVISYQDGHKLVPSVVGVSPKDELLVGIPAKNQYIVEPEHTIRSIKRVMGTDIKVLMGGREYLPQEISAFILRKMASIASAYVGKQIHQAVITVPAYFSDGQRTATREAGEIAGLEVVRIINEPTAAALAYGVDKDESQMVLVYDLGGGTFDVSIVEIEAGVIEVVATAGNNKLGGDDFDQRIIEHVLENFKSEHGIDLRDDSKAMARLIRAAEMAKIRLSDHPYAKITEEFITIKDGNPVTLDIELSREQFETMIEDLLDETLELVERVLKDADLMAEDVDKVLLVGGSTRIPMVSEKLEERIGVEPYLGINPDECVALGASIQAGIIQGEDINAVLVDVNPYSLGIATVDYEYGVLIPDKFSVLIKRNTAIPTSKSEVYTTFVDNQKSVKIAVYQGEEFIASENVLLGEFLLEDIDPAPAGVPKIVVAFDYDVDGIVHVTALNKDTGKVENLTITNAREKMTEYEKERAREHTDELWDDADFSPDDLDDPKVLLNKAYELVDNLDDPDIASKLRKLIGDAEKALDLEDHELLETCVDRLLDMLYELED